MKNLIMIFTTVALFSVCAGSVTAVDSIFKLGPTKYPDFNAKTAEPALTYGKTNELPLPKTILFCVGVDELIADAEEWSSRGINAFFVRIAREWSSDIWGEDINYRQHFGTQTYWMLIGPFPNDQNYSGYDTVYPPEQSIDLNGIYLGLAGKKVVWVEHNPGGSNASVNLAAVFAPKDYVCAYALCYVTAPEAMDVQLRLCTNDCSKLWLDGKLIFDNPQEGRIILDKNIIPVTLPKGTVPVLLKVCQGQADWGFIFRITDAQGRPLKNLRFSPTATIGKNAPKQDKNNKRNLMSAAHD